MNKLDSPNVPYSLVPVPLDSPNVPYSLVPVPVPSEPGYYLGNAADWEDRCHQVERERDALKKELADLRAEIEEARRLFRILYESPPSALSL